MPKLPTVRMPDGVWHERALISSLPCAVCSLAHKCMLRFYIVHNRKPSHTHTHTNTLRSVSYACCYLAPLYSIRNTHPHLVMFECALRHASFHFVFCQRLSPGKVNASYLPLPPTTLLLRVGKMGHKLRRLHWAACQLL